MVILAKKHLTYVIIELNPFYFGYETIEVSTVLRFNIFAFV